MVHLVSNQLNAEVERVQTISLRTISMDKGSLQSLSSRRELAIMREVRRIQDDQYHSYYGLLSEPTDHSYSLRSTNGGRYYIFSRTQRHKLSLIARSCKYV